MAQDNGDRTVNAPGFLNNPALHALIVGLRKLIEGLNTRLSDLELKSVNTGTQAGGDLSGTYPNPTVSGIQGRSVASGPPSNGEALTWDAGLSQWIPKPKADAAHTHAPPDISPQGSGSGLDADTVDGQHASAFAQASHGHDHGALTGLSDDDHTQYVHTSIARTITAQHTFNPPAAGPPFNLGANAQGQLVSGLDADTVDGKHASDLANASHTHVEADITDLGATVVKDGDPAGGDLSGTYPNPTVSGLQGRPLDTTAPSDGDAYLWDAATGQWIPGNPSTTHSHALGDLSDVTITTPSSNEVLKYDGTGWVNGTVPGHTHTESDITDLGATVVKDGDPAGGDLNGTYPNPTVAGIHGRAVDSTAPSDKQAYLWNAATSTWKPADVWKPGDVLSSDRFEFPHAADATSWSGAASNVNAGAYWTVVNDPNNGGRWAVLMVYNASASIWFPALSINLDDQTGIFGGSPASVGNYITGGLNFDNRVAAFTGLEAVKVRTSPTTWATVIGITPYGDPVLGDRTKAYDVYFWGKGFTFSPNNGVSTFFSHVEPGDDNARDLGTSTNRWRDIYVSTTRTDEIYLNGDAAGDRLRRHAFVTTSPTDHFDGTTLDSAWSWAGAPFGGQPTYNMADSVLAVYNDFPGAGSFVYRAFGGALRYAKFYTYRNDPANQEFGLRVDDGSDNNFYELFFRTTGGFTADIVVRYREAGGAVSEYTIHTCDTYQLPLLSIHNYGTTTFVPLLSIDWRVLNYAYGKSFPSSTTFTRSGIIHRTLSSTPTWYRYYTDWFHQQ